MIALLPIIEQLAEAADHAARARWLLRCPLDILGRYEGTIRNRLMHAGFIAGLDYLDALRVVKSSVRGEDGQLTGEQVLLLEAAGLRLAAAAQPAPIADHSVTEI